MRFSKLHIFLPVHNRGPVTATFISHVMAQIRNIIPYEVWILNDGCTDNTIELALEAFPAARVITLSGSAYWGGALNAIKQIIVNRHNDGFQHECYLVCNDDIRFSSGSLELALDALLPTYVVCALAETIEHDLFLSDNILRTDPTPLLAMHRFDSSKGQFVVESDPLMVDVSSTYAMLTTVDPWLLSDPIPLTIPHYLSDWWLTYGFSKLGFKIVHPPGFTCFTSALTTNNKFTYSTSDLVAFPFLGWFRSLFMYAAYSVDPRTPCYSPAWITFLRKHSNPTQFRISLFRYYFLFFLGSSLKFLRLI